MSNRMEINNGRNLQSTLKKTFSKTLEKGGSGLSNLDKIPIEATESQSIAN